jgi:hypothetical protein
METEKHNSKQRIAVRVPDVFEQLLVVELAMASGIDALAQGRSRKRVVVSCAREQADALLADAERAVSVLQLLQLEGVARAIGATGHAPSQNLLDTVAELRSSLGNLVAGV